MPNADITAYVNVAPSVPSLTQNGPKKGAGVTFYASGGTNYQWTGAFNGQTGSSKTTAATEGNYTTSVRNYVTANGITCYSAYTGNVTGVVEKAGPTIPGLAWTNTQVLGSQYSWKSAQSACPSGWRLPTRAEFQAMINAGSTWRTANSGYGNTENGKFFGSNSAACTIANGNCVFLPARPNGSNGSYWSSDSSYALRITYDISSVNQTIGNTSVLCVQ